LNLSSAKQVLMRTHIAAINAEYRANGMMLVSGPGVGKSDTMRQYCETLASELNEPVGLVQFFLATVSSVDVRGFMLPVKGIGTLDTVFSTPPWMPVKGNTEVVEPDGTWHKPGAWQGDVPRVGVLALDEFSQAEDDVKKPAAELIYKGNVGTAELPPAWRVVAAGNRMQDRSGVLRELMFLVNRRCLLNIEASLPSWIEWANNQLPEKRPHYLTLSFAQKNPDIVFKDEVPAGTDPFCTPRTLCLMDRDLRALRSDEDIANDRLPLDAISREVAAGWIGAGSAAQYFTHLKYADELPDIADIEKDPKKAKLPSNRDAQMVCGYMLAHNVTDKNAGNILAYINRLNVEMQVLAVRTITSQQERAKYVSNTKPFVDWLIKNKDIMVASRS
jgi:hypothetical protein